MAKKNVVLDPNETHGGQQSTEVKTSKPREVKVKHAQGSPHDVLITFVNKLSPTQADWFMRYLVKPHFAKIETKENEESLQGEIEQAIKLLLAPKAA